MSHLEVSRFCLSNREMSKVCISNLEIWKFCIANLEILRFCMSSLPRSHGSLPGRVEKNPGKEVRARRTLYIRHFWNEKRSGAEIRLTIVSGIFTGDIGHFFHFSLITVSVVIAKVYSVQSPSRLESDECSCHMLWNKTWKPNYSWKRKYRFYYKNTFCIYLSQQVEFLLPVNNLTFLEQTS